MRKAAKQINYEKILIYIALSIGSIIMIAPFVWMLLTSFKSLPESMSIPPTFIPESFSNTAAYTQVVKILDFGRLYLNTGLMILFRILCATIFCSMSGYAFAKLEIPFKKFFFTIVLVQMMLPGQIFLIPQYQMVVKLGLTDSIFGLVFPGIVSAFGTFFLRQFYMGLPEEMFEAASLDGCSQFQTFYKIAMPTTKSAIAALSIFTAVIAYGELMWPLIVNTDKNMLTLSSGLSLLKGHYVTNYPVLMAGAVLAMIPMMIIYIFCQKHFIEGIALTGIKA